MSTKRKRQPARSQVPTEFRGGSSSGTTASAQATPEPQPERVMLPPGWKPFMDRGFISQPQHSYISGMLDKRDLLSSETFRAKVEGMDAEQFAAYIAELKETFKRLPRGKASELIETLKALPYKPKASGSDAPAKKTPDVHAGRYALRHPGDELNPVRFYKVSEGKDNTEKGGKNWSGVVFLERFASDDTHPIKYRSAEYYRVLEQIVKSPLEAAQLFAEEFGVCSQCGRGLTRRLSRELAIGPVCLRKVGWLDDPEAYIQAATDRILARGEDPKDKLPAPTGRFTLNFRLEDN